MSSLLQRPLRRALAGLGAAALATFTLLAVSPAAPASAETPGVTATCATLTVKPNGYAAKGEVRVVIDGEVQTDGDEDGWTEFKGSFPGVYAFEPDVAHTYTVEINSYAADSSGDGFTPGVGGDATFRGPTVPCAAVGITAAASNCLSEKAAQKQAVDLEFTGLRRSVTYLAEVIDAGGATVKHFQFRTSPVVEHRFSGLDAGAQYRVRLTDQSNPILSDETTVAIPGCAAVPTVDAHMSRCTPDSRTARVVATLSDLPVGRVYAVALHHGSYNAVRFATDADGAEAPTFEDVPRGARYTLTVADDAAPMSVEVAVDVPSCAADSPSGSASAGAGTADPSGTDGSGTVGAGGSSHAPAPTGGAGSMSPPPATPTPGAPSATGGGAPTATPVASAPPSTDTDEPSPFPTSTPTVSATESSGAGIPTDPSAHASAGSAAAADAGPGETGDVGSGGGTSPGGNGLVAATGAVAPSHAVPTSTVIGVILIAGVVLALAAVVIRTRRRKT